MSEKFHSQPDSKSKNQTKNQSNEKFGTEADDALRSRMTEKRDARLDLDSNDFATLPPHPNINSLKKQAKRLFREFQQQQPSALAQVHRWHPEPASFSSLRDAQLVIARKFGFSGWSALSDAVDTALLSTLSLQQKIETFIDIACLRYDGQDSNRNFLRARRMLQRFPELSSANLVCAILCNNLPLVEQLLQDQPGQATQLFAPRNWPPLMYLAYNRVLDSNDVQTTLAIANLLLRHGADPNAHNTAEPKYHFAVLTGVMGEGESGTDNQPPHPAAKPLAQLLLDAGANPNDSQGLYNTMFTASGDYWLAFLVAHGLNASHKVNWDASDSARTVFNYLLETAVSRQFHSRVNTLLALGADPNAHCHYSDRSIYTHACIVGNQEIIASLRRAGGHSTDMSVEDRFILAVRRGEKDGIAQLAKSNLNLLDNPSLLKTASIDTLIFLLGIGYQINKTTDSGETLLHIMAKQGNLECVKFLLDNGADPEIRDRYYHGKAVAHAHFNNQPELRDFLLEYQQNPMEATASGQLSILRKILDREPMQAKIKGFNGNTLLHVVCNWLGGAAEIETREAIMKLLLQHGADIHAVNDAGQTPLAFNDAINDDDNVTLLQELGATH